MRFLLVKKPSGKVGSIPACCYVCCGLKSPSYDWL